MVASITHSDTIRPSPMKFIYAPPGLNRCTSRHVALARREIVSALSGFGLMHCDHHRPGFITIAPRNGVAGELLHGMLDPVKAVRVPAEIMRS
jgi:hypothetical protein